MSRVQAVQKDQARPEVREIYDKIEENGAKVLTLYRVLAHSPNVLRNFLRLGGSLLVRAELSPKLRELAILRVAKRGYQVTLMACGATQKSRPLFSGYRGMHSCHYGICFCHPG